jgi:MFS family permease
MALDTKPEEQYIESTSAEISVGDRLGWTGKIMSAFPAFKSRNYRLYFAGQLISLVGTWLQIVAEGWLVFELTNSAFWVGLDAAMATIPVLFLSLLGGVIVDRYPKKNILFCTQSAFMIFALILGILTITHVITVWEIIIISFLLGVINAIDSPARQAYMSELIDSKKSLSSVIAINSAMFNAARVIGPTIAGILIAMVGAGYAFIVNGISYIAVIIALYFIATPSVVQNEHFHPIRSIVEGLRYAFSHTLIRSLLILTGAISIFGWSYSTLMPVIAKQLFGLNASGLGYLYAAAGLGAFLATMLISIYSNRVNPRIFIVGGVIVFAVSLLVFTFVTNFYIALILLFLIGLGLVSQFSMTAAVIQHTVDNAMRGRVLSLYTLVFIGFGPIGNFEIGYVAEHFGLEFAIRLGALIALVFGVLALNNKTKIKINF